MKITIITRTIDKEYNDCKEWLNKFTKNKFVDNFIIISNLQKNDGKIGPKKLYSIFNNQPTNAVSLNSAILKLKGIYNDNKLVQNFFVVVSKEVELESKHVDILIKKIVSDKNLLVVGFDLKDNILTNKEYDIFSNGNGIAYKVPWNTCAIWNYDLFEKYVKEFDEICSNNQFTDLKIKIDNQVETTKYEGMEDGLAILKAQNENKKIRSVRLKDKLFWNIPSNRASDHKLKMARKNIVLSTFANIKGYSVDKLKTAA